MLNFLKIRAEPSGQEREAQANKGRGRKGKEIRRGRYLRKEGWEESDNQKGVRGEQGKRELKYKKRSDGRWERMDLERTDKEVWVKRDKEDERMGKGMNGSPY